MNLKQKYLQKIIMTAISCNTSEQKERLQDWLTKNPCLPSFFSKEELTIIFQTVEVITSYIDNSSEVPKESDNV
jgi:hypothetical protein